MIFCLCFNVRTRRLQQVLQQMCAWPCMQGGSAGLDESRPKNPPGFDSREGFISTQPSVMENERAFSPSLGRRKSRQIAAQSKKNKLTYFPQATIRPVFNKRQQIVWFVCHQLCREGEGRQRPRGFNVMKGNRPSWGTESRF